MTIYSVGSEKSSIIFRLQTRDSDEDVYTILMNDSTVASYFRDLKKEPSHTPNSGKENGPILRDGSIQARQRVGSGTHVAKTNDVLLLQSSILKERSHQ